MTLVVNRKSSDITIGAFAFLLLFIFTSCQPSTHWKTVQGLAQGTTYTVRYEGRPSTEQIKRELDQLLLEVDFSMSTYRANSLISQFNRDSSHSVALDSHFKIVFNSSRDLFERTTGFFDPTVAPLVDLWGFGFKKRSKVTQSRIDSGLSFVGLNKVSLRENKLIKGKEGVKLDFNAIAQGYSVDEMAALLENYEILNYMIELGGEVKTKGHNEEGRPWRIGIETPNFEGLRELFTAVELSDQGLATSGNYRKFWVDSLSGKRYAHSINPITGKPVQHTLLSATVIAPTTMWADGLATAFMVMGADSAKRWIERDSTLEGLLITTSPESGDSLISWQSSGLNLVFKPVN